MVARAVLIGAPLRSGRYRFSVTETLGLPDDQGTAAERAAVMARLGSPQPAGGQRPALSGVESLTGDGPDGTEGALTRLAAYATLAPSPHNTQPWVFSQANGSLTIGPDRGRALAVADPQGRALMISLGCCAMSALVAAAAAGLRMTVTSVPGAGVRLDLVGTGAGEGAGADGALARLFPVLTTRVSDKREYPPDEIQPPLVPLPEGIDVHYVADAAARTRLADLHRRAVAELAETGAFAGELARWLRADPTDPRRDGMTLPLLSDAADALIVALSRSGGPLLDLGERDAAALAAGPMIGLLTSEADAEDAWGRTGLAWQRLALTAHTGGLAVAPLTAGVENPQTRQAAAAFLSPGRHIQMLFRLGRSPSPLPPTARRDPAWSAAAT